MFTISEISKDVSAQLIAKTNIYQLLSKAFSPPSEANENAPKLFRLASEELSFDLKRLGSQVSKEWNEAMKNREAFLLAYTKLFIGPFEILVSPYASTYLENDGKLMGQVSIFVADRYAECGIGPNEAKPQEIPDHIALECEFLYYLGYQEIKTGDQKWEKERLDFIQSHVKKWIPDFVNAIIENDIHPFYTRLAQFINVFLMDRE